MTVVWSLMRGAMVALLLVPAAALAADLDDGAADARVRSGYESPYDDPRYRDIYGHPEPPRPRYAAPSPPYDDRRSLRDDEYLEPMTPPPRFSERRPRFVDRFDGCLTRREIRQRLIDDGFTDFRDLEPRGRAVLVTARRPSGHLFDLEVDRCTGDIVSARRIDPGHGRPYASEPRPRRFDRIF